MKKVTLHPMTEADVEWLEQRLMEYGNDDSMLSLSALDGFLTAVLSGPKLVSPSQWWPVLWGGMPPEWSSEREMKRALDLIMGHMNILAHTLCYQPEHFIPVLMVNLFEEQEICNAEEWCFGYLRGMALGNWPALPEELDTWLEVIRLHGSDDQLPLLASLSLPVTVVDYHEHAIGAGANAEAVCYVELRVNNNDVVFGVGVDGNIVAAAMKAILAGLNRHARNCH